MKNSVKKFLLFILMVIILTATIAPVSVSAKNKPYNFVTIDFPGATKTEARGINPQGDIVGTYWVGAISHGFLLKDGNYTSLDFPGDEIKSTEANAISVTGDIVGSYTMLSGRIHGYLLTKHGEWSTVDYPYEDHFMAGGLFDIAPNGTVVGCMHDQVGVSVTSMFGYAVYPDGTAEKFDSPDQHMAMHYGTSPNGAIVGTYRISSTPWEYIGYLITKDGEFIPFDVPNSSRTTAVSVNAAGIIAGTYWDIPYTANKIHGFVVETNGSVNPDEWVFNTIDFPGADRTGVYRINSNGAMVGWYFAGGTNHGFLASRK